MSDPTSELIESGSPDRRRPTRTRLAAWGAVGVLAVLAVSGILISQVNAATATQTPTPSATSPDPDEPDELVLPGPRGHLKRFVPGFPGRGLGGTLHGEFTAETDDGVYKVFVVQRGEVTGKGENTLTVKSEDGFTATYAINDDTRIIKDGDSAKLADIANGDTVHVMGTKSGGSTTATFVLDGQCPGMGFRHWGWRDKDRDVKPAPTTPSASTTS
jgi:Domain of unknown function (DUF5666)